MSVRQRWHRWMHLSWRYWMDVRSVAVLLLFLLHFYVVYDSAVGGSVLTNKHGSLSRWHPHADAVQQPVPIGPMYSFRVHFYMQHGSDGDVEATHAVTRALAPADALILMFKSGDADCNETAVVVQFSQTKLWSFVVPLNPSHDFRPSPSYRLPERHLRSAGKDDNPAPVLIPLQNISAFLDAEEPASVLRTALRGAPITACFLVGTDPVLIPISTGGTLRDELLAGPGNSRISSMALHLNRLHGASWSVFVSPCRTNYVYAWEQHDVSASDTNAAPWWWWVCVASDTLLELNTAARLITVLADE